MLAETHENDFQALTLEIERDAFRNAGLRISSIDQIETKPIDWLAPDILPKGQLSLLTGDTCSGKTVLACDLIAKVTSGVQVVAI